MTGRYDRSEVRTHVTAGGDEITYLTPRLLPRGSTTTSGLETTVAASEVARPDLVAFRTLQQPLLAYLLADSSDAMDLIGLCPAAGATVALPKAGP